MSAGALTLHNRRVDRYEALRALRFYNFGDAPDLWEPEFLGGIEEEEQAELEGLGSFLKKIHKAITGIALAPIKLISPQLAANLNKIDDKILALGDKVDEKLQKFWRKNWKWVAVIIIIAITIYTLGAGATIAAKMLSGAKVLGGFFGFGGGGGAAAAGGAAAGSAGTSLSAGAVMAEGGGITTAAVGGSSAAAAGGWAAAAKAVGVGVLKAAGKSLAMSAVTQLVSGKKVSDLSQEQAIAMVQAQQAGYDMGLGYDPKLADAMAKRAAIPGGPIPTDAYGRPLTDPTGSNADGQMNWDNRMSPQASALVADEHGAFNAWWLLPAAAGVGAVLWAKAS